MMWCVGRLTEEYRQRMYDLLELYARPWRADQPVVCIDEKSKQLLQDSRSSLPMAPGKPAQLDYEYVRAGTCNVFVAVEPQGGHRMSFPRFFVFQGSGIRPPISAQAES